MLTWYCGVCVVKEERREEEDSKKGGGVKIGMSEVA
jgi:hypothetical protein